MIDLQTQTNTPFELHDQVSRTPSPHLLELCHAYLALVDHGTPEQQGEERTRAHNALIEQMVAEGIVEPTPHRVLVRWKVGMTKNGRSRTMN